MRDPDPDPELSDSRLRELLHDLLDAVPPATRDLSPTDPAFVRALADAERPEGPRFSALWWVGLISLAVAVVAAGLALFMLGPIG
jgi:hypothetical protein